MNHVVRNAVVLPKNEVFFNFFLFLRFKLTEVILLHYIFLGKSTWSASYFLPLFFPPSVLYCNFEGEEWQVNECTCLHSPTKEGTANKNDLVESITHAAQINKNIAERGFNGLLSTLLSAMKEGKCVKLIGFSSFSVVDRASRIGRNPRTGELVPIPPRWVVKFRQGKDLSLKIQ